MTRTLDGLELFPLEESAALLKLTLRAAQAGSWAWDILTGGVFWSEEFHHLVGTSPETCRPSYEAWVQTIHPEDRQAALAEMQAAVRERRELRNEFRVLRPDGAVRWLRSQGQTLYDRDGTPLRMVGVTFDITERKLAEEELRIITDGVPVLISYVDAGQRYRFNNLLYEKWFGHQRDEIRGRHVREVLGEAAYEEIRHYVETALSGREVRFERWIDYKTAGRVCVEARYVPHRGPGGEVLGFFAVVNDITSHKQADAAVRETEERLRLATQAASIGIWSWNAVTDEVVWTPECHRIMGVAEFGGRLDDFNRLLHPDDAGTVWAAVGQAIEHRVPYKAEFRVIRPDGEVRWLLNHGTAEHDDTGKALRLLGIVIDITDRKHVEESLRAADRRKDEFLAMLAHELRNPLAPIRNAVQVMRQLDDGDAIRLRQMRDIVDRQADQLSRIVDDLLDVSRIGLGKIALRRERLDLRVIAERAVEISQPLIDERGHRLKVSLPAAPLPVDGDGARLAQVVCNLLNNAAKYTQPGGSLGLAAEALGGEARIRIEDDGIGIPAEMLPRIFDLYTQEDRSSGSARGGLGIGLTLARSLVELHGGTVSAQSPGPGRGSVFTVHLPLASEPPEARGQAEESARPAACLRILVVDDDADTAESLALLLGLKGHEARAAHNGADALEAAGAFLPRAVLLDIGLPDMTGYEVARSLRGLPGMEAVVLIALTGYGQEEDRQKALDAGFDHYMVKPVDFAALKTLLDSVV